MAETGSLPTEDVKRVQAMRGCGRWGSRRKMAETGLKPTDRREAGTGCEDAGRYRQ